ncbi:hypothetical protein Acr_28g0004760 [Actinidia rufa]|uniref:Uncharacterized protein n=1 Tax=Actinidia rufa TaxID=165716 RepID=A0A7J0H9Z0_9ERIC|nr:hypothetical protein Acr_28g0004760 [Actinidia rufa]
MKDEVTRLPSSPREDQSSPKSSPSVALPPIEARPKRTLFGDYPSNVKGWKRKFFFIFGTTGNSPKGLLGKLGLQGFHGYGVPQASVEVQQDFEFSQRGFIFGQSGPRIKDLLPELRYLIETNGQGPSVPEKILSGVVPLANKEKVEQLTLDQNVTRFYHAISQAVVFDSSLAIWSKEMGDELEGQLAKARVREQQSVEESAKMKDAQDAIADKLAKSEILVAELRKSVVRSKKLALKAFKSSKEFLDAVEVVATKYFGKGFDFYKRQLRHHHPDLAIDFEGMGLDHDLLDEEEQEGEQGDVDAENKEEEEKKEDEATSSFSP